ncbi:MAG TPA: hypothetical protein VIN59_00255 [Alphaproteobacteria bacterium]
MSAFHTNAVTQDIWIAFSGICDVRLLKILKPGFRHCFAIIREKGAWIVVDPMLHKLDVTTTHLPEDFDFPAWLRNRGYRVVRAPHLSPRRILSLPSPFTCVEAMKRLIGLQNWKVLTPWQLYRTLLQTSFKGECKYGKHVFKT